MTHVKFRKLVTIAQYRDVPLAGLAKSRLNSAGIECFLDNEFTIGINWLYSNALGGVKLKVFEADELAALEIITDEEQTDPLPESASSDQLPSFACPKCGATEIETKNCTRKFAAISLLMSLPLFFFLKRYHCKQCGHEWK
jgi:predicted RNA-binding Zn-ribbon protein involved in translation (DUF1610 family)